MSGKIVSTVSRRNLLLGAGAGLVGFDGGTVETALNQGVFMNTVHVKRYGAMGDGVTNDTAALQAAAAALKDGQTLEFEQGKRYLITDRIQSKKNNLTIRGNGATLVLSANGKTAFQLGGFDQIYGTPYLGTTNSLNLSIEQGSSEINVPGIGQASAGKIALIYNAIDQRPEVNVGSGNKYFFGFLREIESYTADSLKIFGSFPSSYTATTIEVFSASKFSRIEQLHVDLSNATDCNGIDLYGINSEVKQCSVYGNEGRSAATFDKNRIGIMVRGVSCTVRNCEAKNIFNSGGGSIRTGYGIEVAGVNCKITESKVDNCKHCISTSERRFLDTGLIYEAIKVTQDVELFGMMLADGVTPLISWPLDIHANAAGVEILNCHAIGPSFLLGVRNGNVSMRGGLLKHNRLTGNGRFGLSINEMPINSMTLTGVEIDCDITAYWNLDGTNKNIRIEKSELNQRIRFWSGVFDSNLGLWTGVSNFENITISENTFKPKNDESIAIDISSSISRIKNLRVIGNYFDLSAVSNATAIRLGIQNEISGGEISGNTFKAGINSKGIVIASESMLENLKIERNRFSRQYVMAIDVEITGSGNYTFNDNECTGPVLLSDMEYRTIPNGNTFNTTMPKPFSGSGLFIGNDGWYFEPQAPGNKPVHGVFKSNEQVKLKKISLSTPIAYVSRQNPQDESAPYSSLWAAGANVSWGTQVKHPSGAVLVATVAGVTGGSAPSMPANRYEKATDGTVTWKYLCPTALEPDIWSAVNHS